MLSVLQYFQIVFMEPIENNIHICDVMLIRCVIWALRSTKYKQALTVHIFFLTFAFLNNRSKVYTKRTKRS